MKYAVILGNVGSCSDRYMTGGYSEPFTVEQLFERLSTIDNVHAVEFVGGWQLTLDNRQMVKEQLEKYKLTPVSIIPDHFGRPIWGLGAFTHPDPDVRQAAVKETMDMVEAARFIGCDTISIWNGQDGYDYPLQANYADASKWLVEGLRECALAAPDIRFSLEYTPSSLPWASPLRWTHSGKSRSAKSSREKRPPPRPFRKSRASTPIRWKGFGP